MQFAHAQMHAQYWRGCQILVIATMETSSSYICPLCSISCSTLKLYVSHLRVQHAKDPSFNVLCGIGNCREVFRTFSAFNSHVYRHHRSDIGIRRGSDDHSTDSERESGLLHQSGNPDERIDATMDWQEQQNTEDLILGCTSDKSLTLSQERNQFSGSNPKLEAAKMLLQLREGHQVSHIALAEVISCCQSLCNAALTHLKTDLDKAVESGEDTNLALENYDPFKGVDTNYLFEKYCIDHLGCLVS